MRRWSVASVSRGHVACILRSGTSASALTATGSGWPAPRGSMTTPSSPGDHGLLAGLSRKYLSIAARPADGAGAAARAGAGLAAGGSSCGEAGGFACAPAPGGGCSTSSWSTLRKAVVAVGAAGSRLDPLGDLCRRSAAGGRCFNVRLDRQVLGLLDASGSSAATARTMPKRHRGRYRQPSLRLWPGVDARRNCAEPSRSCRTTALGRSNSPALPSAMDDRTSASERVATTGALWRKRQFIAQRVDRAGLRDRAAWENLLLPGVSRSCRGRGSGSRCEGGRRLGPADGRLRPAWRRKSSGRGYCDGRLTRRRGQCLRRRARRRLGPRRRHGRRRRSRRNGGLTRPGRRWRPGLERRPRRARLLSGRPGDRRALRRPGRNGALRSRRLSGRGRRDGFRRWRRRSARLAARGRSRSRRGQGKRRIEQTVAMGKFASIKRDRG